MNSEIKSGDFSLLSENYSKFRPDYSEKILNKLLELTNKRLDEIKFADVGAGTGIWTRMVFNKGVKNSIAIEPNENMRQQGEIDSKNTEIIWKKGRAENIPIKDSKLLLGKWKRIFFVELDPTRERELIVTFMNGHN